MVRKLKIHHVGYAVNNIEKASKAFLDLGFTLGNVFVDEIRMVEICFLQNDGYTIELVAPHSVGSPIDRILEKNGPTPYHICFETDNIYASIDNLSVQGFRLIVKPAPAPAINYSNVAFLFSNSAGLIELVELI